MRKALRIAGRIGRYGVTAVAFGAAAFLVVPQLLGWKVVTVVSGSMEPTYPVDSALVIKSVEPESVREGDVIAFVAEADQPWVAHRVIAVETSDGRTAFITKGDANEDPDYTPVLASAVRGRVIAGVPYLGLFVRAVHTPVGFVVLLVLPALALIGLEIASARRGRSEERHGERIDQEVLT